MPDDPTWTHPKLMRVAREALRMLDGQSVSPIPPNFETFFLAVARRQGMPEGMLEEVRSQQGASIPVSTADLGSDVAEHVMRFVLRLSTRDGIVPAPLGRLFRQVQKLVDAGRISLQAGQVLDALRSAARRSLAGQLNFDPDKLLRVQPDAPAAPTPGSEEERAVEKVLDLVLRLTIAHGTLPAGARGVLRSVLASVEAQRLLIDFQKHTAALKPLLDSPTAAPDGRAVSAPPPAGAMVGGHDTARDALADLLPLLRCAVGGSEEATKHADRLRSTLLQASTDPEIAARDVSEFVQRYATFFAELPQQQLRSEELVKAGMDSIRIVIQTAAGLSDRLDRQVHQLSRLDAQSAVALKGVVERELTGVAHDLRHMMDQLDDLNEPLWQAFSAVSALETDPDGPDGPMKDPLTGLPTERGFTAWVTRVLRKPGGDYAPFSAVVFELDRLRKVNEALGRSAGDAILHDTAARLRKALPRLAFTCRSAGEEFRAALPGYDLDAAEDAAHHALAAIRKPPFLFQDRPISITASAGAVEHRDGESAADTVERAVHALHLAKAKGGDRCRTEADLERAATPYNPLEGTEPVGMGRRSAPQQGVTPPGKGRWK